MEVIIEEFGPKMEYYPGKLNVVADALSRVPVKDEEKSDAPDMSVESFSVFNTFDSSVGNKLFKAHVEDVLAKPDNHEVVTHEVRMTECHMAEGPKSPHETPVDPYVNDLFLLCPSFDARMGFCDFETMHRYQREDTNLLHTSQSNPDLFEQTLGGYPIICLKHDPNWKIIAPTNMLPRLINFYHETLAHSEGADRLCHNLARIFHHPRLKETVHDTISNCDICERMKPSVHNFGKLPPRIVPLSPWREVHLDCIGNWHVEFQGISLDFNALTMIDPVSCLLEVVSVPKARKSICAWRAFDNNWLARYPKPFKVVHDRGNEFLGHEFQNGLSCAGIIARPISARSPQANGIIERVHAIMAQIIRTYLERHPPVSEEDKQATIDAAFALCVHATRCAAHSQLDWATPGSIAFGRDVLLNIPFVVDLIDSQKSRQQKVDNRLIRANQSRKDYHCEVDEFACVLRNDKDKLKPKWDGPCIIEQCHTNGTVTIRVSPDVTDRVNIRLLKPA